MTVAASEPQKVTVNGNGVATSFSFSPMIIYENNDLEVTHVSVAGVETLLTEGVGAANYTVVVAAFPGTGSITYPSTGATRLLTGEKLVMKAVLAFEQKLDLENQGGYFPDLQETAFDKAVKIDIQQQEEIDRSLRLPISTNPAISTELEIPSADKLIGWNATATALVNKASAGTITVSPFMESVLDDANAAAARVTLDVPSNSEALLDTIIDAAGDLIVGTAADTPARLPRGSTDTLLQVDASGALAWGVEDSRTNTVRAAILKATTSGTPAAGIGTGLKFQAESGDENPADFGQIEFVASDVGVGTEDTYFQVLLRVAGAVLTSCYRFVATGAFNAIFTHANTAARTYTLPDRSGTIGITLGTEVASTSGTSIDFTGIPAGTRRITIMLSSVSTNGAAELLFQLGDAGDIEATGYVGAGQNQSGTGTGYTSGFGLVGVGTAAGIVSGCLTLTLENAAAFTWAAAGTFARTDSALCMSTAGVKSLSAELDRVRITTTNGTDTFDAGVINITYEM